MINSSLTDGKVLEQSVESVANGSKYRVNNSYDKYYAPRRKEDIVAMAKQQVGKKMTYNLMVSNCEHFSTFMRYGVASSKQARESRIAHCIHMVPVFRILRLFHQMTQHFNKLLTFFSTMVKTFFNCNKMFFKTMISWASLSPVLLPFWSNETM
ncbi:phospholipase A and acyltransferase 4-like [Xenopus tropicalis]|uniref:Phospholipase A and acyltransferase 4-like n=1 Tax=Xenopus tropicalis TaxID=8364 RepID=A0A8J1IN86_XENTR|nr:phospholipase A and acyltransferase 4-like [Xenopus tropicalis]